MNSNKSLRARNDDDDDDDDDDDNHMELSLVGIAGGGNNSSSSLAQSSFNDNTTIDNNNNNNNNSVYNTTVGIVSNQVNVTDINVIVIEEDGDGNNEELAEMMVMMVNDTHDDIQQAAPDMTQYIISFNEFLNNPSQELFKSEFLSIYIDEETALTQAIRTQNVKAVEILISCGADANGINKKSVTPIAAAAHRGNTEIIQILVDAGATMNALNGTGSTALIQAAHFGHVEAVRLLIKNNAAADYANLKGTTALMRASQEGHLDISKELINAGADVNKKNHEGMNALMLASQRGHAEMAYLLVRNGAAKDEQTSQGSTALMLACKRGNRGCVDVLVSTGAEIFMSDCRGRTARDTATRRQHDDLLQILDTQVQVRKIQENRRKIRSVLLTEIRSAAYLGHVDLVASEGRVDSIYRAVVSNDFNNPLLRDPANSTAIRTIRNLKRDHDMTNLDPILAATRPGYAEWQWPALLLRCTTLPPGIFELIADMLPGPRIWQWSLMRLKRRCKLSPVDAIKDISILMDEILTDLNIFSGTDHSNLLVKIARNPQIHNHLLNHWGMPHTILEQLCLWSDVQSLVSRSSDQDISFKAPMAKKMLSAAVSLSKWYRGRCTGCKALELNYLRDIVDKNHNAENDATGCNASDPEDVNVENDTETELPMDGEGEGDDDGDDDSDAESAIHSVIHFDGY